MFETETRLYAFSLAYAQKQVAEIDEAKFNHQPFPGANTPLWILGHLAVCTDYGASVFGQHFNCPKDWHRNFGMKSSPSSVSPPHPTKDALLQALAAGHERLTQLALNADPAILAAPHAVDVLKNTPIKTVGDTLAHLMTTHEMMHLGQLSAWRRAMGHAPLF